MHDDGTRRPFKFGRIHKEWAFLAQYNPRLCVLAPRAHLKSSVLAKGYAFWEMFRVSNGEFRDMLYFSFKASLASEQVEDLLRLIRANPYCRFWKDLKPYGRTTIDYLVDFGDGILGEVTMKGDGIMSATRGRHPKVTICDDILSDFSNPLLSADLVKIEKVFRQAIMSLPANPDDPLIVVGTPQSYEDVLYSLANTEGWLWVKYPAIIDEAVEDVQWAEKFTFERLKRIQRSVGRTAFEVEFQLTPTHVANQFFTREDILAVTDASMNPWQFMEEFNKGDLATYGGFDLGKLVHPTHVVIYLELPSGTLVQIYQQFLDHMNYNEQVELLNMLAERFKLSRGYFDATYNMMEDRDLNPAWRGRVFTRNLKADMAILFEKRVFARPDEPGIIMLNSPRQINQITVVDKQLKAATTVEGHGDSFWSVALAIKAADDGPGIIEIGSPNPSILQQSYIPGRRWAQQLGAVAR